MPTDNTHKELVENIRTGKFVIKTQKDIDYVAKYGAQVHYIKKIFADLRGDPSIASEYIKNPFNWIARYEFKNQDRIRSHPEIAKIYYKLVFSFYEKYSYKYINKNGIV